MQYIKKQPTEPQDWKDWFTVPPNRRTYDYNKDSSALPSLALAKKFLLQEQNWLCAYCQSKLDEATSSIEHITPKSKNVDLSTNYHNLVVVCKSPLSDPDTNKKHCDKERGNLLLPSVIFYSDSDCTEIASNRFFCAYSDGKLDVNHNLPEHEKQQIQAFIEILNLNHSLLRSKRAKGYIRIFSQNLSAIPKLQRKAFIMSEYNRVLFNTKLPYRQFILIYLAGKLGI